MTSLVQQRMALERMRLAGLWIFVVAIAFLVTNTVAAATDPLSIWKWLGVVVFLSLSISGAVRLLSARRQLRAFEAEHGPGAGRRD